MLCYTLSQEFLFGKMKLFANCWHKYDGDFKSLRKSFRKLHYLYGFEIIQLLEGIWKALHSVNAMQFFPEMIHRYMIDNPTTYT